MRLTHFQRAPYQGEQREQWQEREGWGHWESQEASYGCCWRLDEPGQVHMRINRGN